MTDKVSKKQRSINMRAVRGQNTRPEILVRKIAYKLGFRFRLHRDDPPGKPDIAFPGLRKAIFVHGCFWHQHPGCKRATFPKSNVRFWRSKLKGNAARDVLQLKAIRRLGWRALVIWECEIKNNKRLTTRIARFLAQ